MGGAADLEDEEASVRLREHAERLEARRVGLPLAGLAIDAVLAHAVLLDPPRELRLRAVALVDQSHGRAALLCDTPTSTDESGEEAAQIGAGRLPPQPPPLRAPVELGCCPPVPSSVVER